MALLWCEARCAFSLEPGAMPGISGDPSNCHQTAPGAFGACNATYMAKSNKWRTFAGQWCCPACWERKHRG